MYSFLVYVCLHLSCVFSFLLDMYLRVELLGYMGSIRGFPGGSDEWVQCSAGDPSSIPRLGRSPEGGNDNPIQYSAWRIPWTEEPRGLQSMRSQGGIHNWVTNTHIHGNFKFDRGCPACFP